MALLRKAGLLVGVLPCGDVDVVAGRQIDVFVGDDAASFDIDVFAGVDVDVCAAQV